MKCLCKNHVLRLKDGPVGGCRIFWLLVCLLGGHRNFCLTKEDQRKAISQSPLHFSCRCDDEEHLGQIREVYAINQLHVSCGSDKGLFVLVRDLCRGDMLSLWIVVAIRS